MEKESPLLPSCTDATFAFLEVVGRQAEEQTESKPRFVPDKEKLDLKLTNAHFLRRKAKANKHHFT